MTSFTWAVILGVAVQALFFHAMPRLSRPDILFAVTVPEAFAFGVGRTIVARYRTIVWTGAAMALALSLLLPTLPISGRGAFLTVAGVAGNTIVGVCAWLWANRKARPYAVVHADVRVASLVPRDTSLPGGALFASGPFAIVAAAAVLAYAYRAEVPEGFPYGMLALGALNVAIMLTVAVSLSRRSRQIAVDGPAAAAEQRFRRVNVFSLLLAAYAAAIMVSVATLELIPAFEGTAQSRVWFVLMPGMLFNFGVLFWMFRVGQGGQRAVPAAARQEAHGDATPDHAWKVGGLFYFNPHDPAIWVEKRVGLGYTLNVGNTRAWLLLGMMLVPAFAARFLF